MNRARIGSGQLAGNSVVGRGMTDADWIRVLDVALRSPAACRLSLSATAAPWAVRVVSGAGLGGVERTDTFQGPLAADLELSGSTFSVDMRAAAPVRLGATLAPFWWPREGAAAAESVL